MATVSHVMNGNRGRVGAETRQRVLAAADQLGYTRSSSARSLRLQRTERVCLVIGGLGMPAADRLVSDVSERADAFGYGTMTIVVDSAARAQKAVELLCQRVADGAVLTLPPPHLTAGMLAPLKRSGLPLVVTSNTVDPDGFDVIRNTVAEACAEAVDHLIASGRERIAYVAHDYELEIDSSSERLGAYARVLERHGRPYPDQLVVAGADDRVSAYRAVTELLARPEPPDAILAASDRAAISSIWALRDAGWAVPDDMAVVGVGNVAEGLITRPTLSTVGPPNHHYHEIGQVLFERVLANEPPPGRLITTPWSFIKRASA